MIAKMAGHIPLSEMIQQTLESVKTKIAAEEKDEKKDEKVKKLVEYEKKEHGGKIPSVKEEKDEDKEEKKASASIVDHTDPEEVEKLASALEHLAETLEKEADAVENGGESHQGGEQLANNGVVGGKQGYKANKSKSHNVPMTPGTTSHSDEGGAKSELMADNMKRQFGPSTSYPAKGPLKTASVHEKIIASRTSEAADYLTQKIAESTQGGMTLDSKSGEGPKPPSDSAGGNELRKHIDSNSAPAKMKKVDAMPPRKRQLAEVLTEPAMSKAHDSKVQENLRNATKGGVKIAAAKALLSKIAEEGCTCGGEGTCKYCKMKAAMKKSE